MKNIILFLLISLSYVNIQAQNLDKMSEAKRNDTLLKIAKKNVLKYGPDFYREYGKPKIEHGLVTEAVKKYFTEEEVIKHKNRSYYTVKYFYDKTQEAFWDDYAAWVFIWGDTGKVISIFFGNGFGLAVEDIETSTRKDPNGFTKMNWQKQPPGKFRYPKPKLVNIDDTTIKNN